MNEGLAIEAVDKIYRSRRKEPVHAVRALSMAVGAGEHVALLGSSGCGKSSTLRMIAGFEETSAGEIRLAGRRIDPLPPARRNVAMAFEGYSLYPPLTVRDNIGFALKSARRPQAQIDGRIDEIADLLEIRGILDRYPVSLSGGQAQRAGLARALVRPADLYLLDEPMSQLEPQLRAVLRGRIKNYLSRHDMTAVFVTHDQTEANALADRIAVMEGGVLQQIATPDELKARPANLFVATFIGEPPMNVFGARVTGDGRPVVEVTGQSDRRLFGVDYGRFPAAGLEAGREVTLGVRPHHVVVGEGPDEAEVVSCQWLGDETHLATDLDGQLMIVVVEGRFDARPGERLPFRVDPAHVHLFDAASGTALSHGHEVTG